MLLSLSLFALCTFLYWNYPILISKLYRRNFFRYWRKIKNCILNYHSSVTTDSKKNLLEKEYQTLKSKASDVLAYYHEDIQNYFARKYQKRGARSSDIVLENFKNCFSPSSIKKIKRTSPDKLNDFDEIAKEIMLMKVSKK